MTISWREKRKIREEGVETQLPSGMMARLRGLPLDVFLLRGNIPETLIPVIVEAVNGGNSALPDSNDFKSTKDYLELTNEIARLCFVWPRIVDDPQTDDEISIEDVDLDDKAFIFSYLGKSANALIPFREESTGNVELVLSGKGHIPSTIENPEDQGVLATPDRP